MADTKLSAVATEATPTVGNERLYGVQDLAGSPTSVYHKLGDVIYYGASAPTSPEDNFLWHETDTGIIWRYGTYASASRWVSVNLYSNGTGSSIAVSSSSFIHLGVGYALHTGYDIYVDTLFFKGYCTTNSGANYFTCSLRKVSGATAPASGAGSSLGSITSSAEAVNTHFDVTPVSVDAVLDATGASIEMPFFDVVRTGTGVGWLNFGISYRLVHP